MQFWGFCMVHHKYRIRAPHRALWCWLSYALFGALFLHFYLDETTPYVRQERLIDTEILKKLKKCTPATLISVNKIIDILLEQQCAETSNDL